MCVVAVDTPDLLLSPDGDRTTGVDLGQDHRVPVRHSAPRRPIRHSDTRRAPRAALHAQSSSSNWAQENRLGPPGSQLGVGRCFHA